ncbi:hypothetical protein A9Q84_07915 [Halobacteriovorax marinus]|uniref:STAS domain-containing protein n=1 Tax=Halobacteriovorax marinus TaxID=97084 RepID=A0A1Y5F6C0_9BACT|nr:hypothetical protein A9Q84_07915 [Halobacteriovorax marinus]
MSDKLTTKYDIDGDTAIVYFKGMIDEDSEFETIKGLSNKTYIFDFDEVSLINSCGIREWVNFLETIPKDVSLTYRNCRQIIIEQINMVHGFIRTGACVESFYAPYYCESCDEEFKVHLKSVDVKDSKAPVVTCSKCQKSELEFDAIEQQYFQFIK